MTFPLPSEPGKQAVPQVWEGTRVLQSSCKLPRLSCSLQDPRIQLLRKYRREQQEYIQRFDILRNKLVYTISNLLFHVHNGGYLHIATVGYILQVKIICNSNF